MKLFPAISKEQASAISRAVPVGTRDPDLLQSGAEASPSFGEVLAHESDKSEHTATATSAAPTAARKHSNRQGDDASQSPSLAGAAIAATPTSVAAASTGAAAGDDAHVSAAVSSKPTAGISLQSDIAAQDASSQAGAALAVYGPAPGQNTSSVLPVDGTAPGDGTSMLAAAAAGGAIAAHDLPVDQNQASTGSMNAVPADATNSPAAPATNIGGASVASEASGAQALPVLPSPPYQALADQLLTAVQPRGSDHSLPLSAASALQPRDTSVTAGQGSDPRHSIASPFSAATGTSGSIVGMAAGNSLDTTVAATALRSDIAAIAGATLGMTAGATAPGSDTAAIAGDAIGSTADATTLPIDTASIAGRGIGSASGAPALTLDTAELAVASRSSGRSFSTASVQDDGATPQATASGASAPATSLGVVVPAALHGTLGDAAAVTSGALQGVWWAAASAAHSLGSASASAGLRASDASPSRTAPTTLAAASGVSSSAAGPPTSPAASAGLGAAAGQAPQASSAVDTHAGPAASFAAAEAGALGSRYLSPVEAGSRQATDRGDIGDTRDRASVAGSPDQTQATVAPLGAFSTAALNASNGLAGAVNTTGTPSLIGERAMQQIADGVLVRHASLHVDSSASSFRVVLEPKTLGQVVVNVTHSQDGLAVSLMTQRPETGTLLHAHLAELMTTLQNSGTGPVHATVALSQDSTTSQRDGSGSNNMSFSSQAQTGQGLASGGQQQNTPQDPGAQRAPWEPVPVTASGRTTSMAGALSRPVPQMLANKHVDFQA